MPLVLLFKLFGKIVEFCEKYKIPLLLFMHGCFTCYKTARIIKTNKSKWKQSFYKSNSSYWIVRIPVSNQLKLISSTSVNHYISENISINNIHAVYDPLMNFLNETKYSLDIAFMTFGSFYIRDKLLELHAKGVYMRAVVDYFHNNNGGLIVDLVKQGIEVIYFKRESPGKEPVFHWKYFLRDYNRKSACVYVGSANLTNAAHTKKTENFMFTSNKWITEELHTNFDCYWYLMPSRQNNTIKRYLYSLPNYEHLFYPGIFKPYQTNYKKMLIDFKEKDRLLRI